MLSIDNSPFGAFVSRLAGLVPLGPQERAALAGLSGAIVQIGAGVDLAPTGRSANVHYVVEGLVGRFAQFSDGARQITALHIPGDVADLHAVVQPGVAPPLQALGTTTLVRVPLQEMAALVRRLPALGQAFWAYCAVEVAVVERWAANLGRRAAIQRMAHLLCEMGLRIEQSGRGTRRAFVLPLSQMQLGDALGLTPVHVNRTLKRLRDDRLVAVAGRQVEILDWPRLRDLGDFDPAYLQLDQRVAQAA